MKRDTGEQTSQRKTTFISFPLIFVHLPHTSDLLEVTAETIFYEILQWYLNKIYVSCTVSLTKSYLYYVTVDVHSSQIMF